MAFVQIIKFDTSRFDEMKALGDEWEAAIGDDLDAMVGQQQVQQHTVVGLRVPDLELGEDFVRTLARIAAAQHRRRVQRRLDREADLAAVVTLAVGDRLGDALQAVAREQALGRRRE